VVFGVALVLSFCSQIKPRDLKINLRWVKSYDGENLENIQKGLFWSMAFAGAELPKEVAKNGFVLKSKDVIEIDFSILGFDKNSQEKWQNLIEYAKNTEEYKKNNTIDLSRFLVFTVYSSWHYYQITGVSTNLGDSLKNTIKSNKLSAFAVTNSCVAKGHRLLKYQIEPDILKSKFLAVEGKGSLIDSSFGADKFEVIDLMPNGQLRYAIYNIDGGLVPYSPTDYGQAGKPAKCMWCHEGIISPLFTDNQEVRGFKKPAEFNQEMIQFQQILNAFRKSQPSVLTLESHKDHTFAELLYIGFMEPSIERLSVEWGVSVAAVKSKLKNLTTHRHHEFDFLGELYDRKEVEKFAKFSSVPFPDSIREPNENEPNIFK
jgi:hypothetical protein